MPLGVDSVLHVRAALLVVCETARVYILLPGVLFLALVCQAFNGEAAGDAAIAVAPEPGPWQYTAVRCGPVYGPFDSESQAFLAGAQGEYGGCNTFWIERKEPWGTDEAHTTGACGSTVWYPRYAYLGYGWDVEIDNARHYLVGYLGGSECDVVGRDGLTVYRRREIVCPDGYRLYATQSTRVCLHEGLPVDDKNAGEKCPAAGNPIIVANGNKYLKEKDSGDDGAFSSLPIVRSYNSLLSDRDQGWGFGWSSEYLVRIEFMDVGGTYRSASISRPDGRRYYFTLDTAVDVWRHDKDIHAELSPIRGSAPIVL